jgi:hypothetical protein
MSVQLDSFGSLYKEIAELFEPSSVNEVKK